MVDSPHYLDPLAANSVQLASMVLLDKGSVAEISALVRAVTGCHTAGDPDLSDPFLYHDTATHLGFRDTELATPRNYLSLGFVHDQSMVDGVQRVPHAEAAASLGWALESVPVRGLRPLAVVARHEALAVQSVEVGDDDLGVLRDPAAVGLDHES
ncbi:unnamed protein product [Phytophthora fragariaefolia]|uniref:Unnamed protein product n=1 Tax=Phytophthora fragariaefolia TaxID=1490495 RepID=A0A9W6U7B7_9STRA|nr:unnamed protein product [Phytophthora fragariaefolia]